MRICGEFKILQHPGLGACCPGESGGDLSQVEGYITHLFFVMLEVEPSFLRPAEGWGKSQEED